jgi:hypothetical protein
MYIDATQSCRAHDSNVVPNSTCTAPQSDDQKEGLLPWMQIPVTIANDKAVCETLLVEEWDRV